MRVCHCTAGRDGKCCQDIDSPVVYPAPVPRPTYIKRCPNCARVIPSDARGCPYCFVRLNLVGSDL